MRSLAQAWPDTEFVQRPAAQLPWFHLCTLLDKVKDSEQRSWYTGKTLEHGWSRQVLTMQIETAAYTRAGSSVTIFGENLPRHSPILPGMPLGMYTSLTFLV